MPAGDVQCVWPRTLLLGAACLVTGQSRAQAQANDPFKRVQLVHGQRPWPRQQLSEATVLTLIGPSGEKRLTLRQLQALPAVRYRATQPQLGKVFEYVGVPVRDLARFMGASGRALRFEADDFQNTITPQDYRYPVMLAYQGNGQALNIRNKGPLTVVFPTADFPERFSRLKYGSKWVWFVARVRAVAKG